MLQELEHGLHSSMLPSPDIDHSRAFSQHAGPLYAVQHLDPCAPPGVSPRQPQSGTQNGREGYATYPFSIKNVQERSAIVQKRAELSVLCAKAVTKTITTRETHRTEITTGKLI